MKYTVQCGYAAYYANIVTVEAGSLDEALKKAISIVNCDEGGTGWKPLDHVGDTYIDAVVEGEDNEKLWEESALPIPTAFTEKAIHLDVEDAPPDEPKTLTKRWQLAKAQGINLATFADSERKRNNP